MSDIFEEVEPIKSVLVRHGNYQALSLDCPLSTPLQTLSKLYRLSVERVCSGKLGSRVIMRATHILSSAPKMSLINIGNVRAQTFKHDRRLR